MAVVSALYLYPIKSCRGIRVQEWPVARRGFVADRRWMIVDATGKFVTQRELAQLALVHTALDGHRLRLTAPGRTELILPLSHEVGETRQVRVWRGPGRRRGARSGQRMVLRLSRRSARARVHARAPPHSENEDRHDRPARAKAGDIVGFADAYPFLLISEASLADLNSRLEVPITMERFRPNIVISGTEPFAEDGYARVRIGEISFRGPKRCDRCVVTTVDPSTGERGREPLRTLAKYRLADQKVWFGMNLIHDDTGVLRVGDSVEPGDGASLTT